MKLILPLGYLIIGIAAAVLIDLLVLWAYGLTDPAPETLIVNPREVVRIFTEERGRDLSEEDFHKAILAFDALVMDEAETIHRATGAILVNGNHMLAGGRDVSADFAARVISRWDALQ